MREMHELPTRRRVPIVSAITNVSVATVLLVVLLVVLAAGLAACGSPAPRSASGPAPGSTPHGASAPPGPGTPTGAATPVPGKSNPPGHIPDNVAFVRYTNSAGGYSFVHPKGWMQTEQGTSVRFTDKLNGLNGIAANVAPAAAAPTVASVNATDIPRLRSTVAAFAPRSVSAVSLPAGSGVLIVFQRNSAPDPVTGRVHRDEVEQYEIFKSGRVVHLSLSSPVGADNVGAYRTITKSLTIT